MKPYQSSTRATANVLRDPVFAANTEGHVYASMMQPRANDDNDDDVIDHTNHGITTIPMKGHSFSPYEMNGGTVAAIAGPNYCIIASDTRCSSGYEILSRNVSHIHTFSNTNIVLASSGCKTDIDQLRSVLDIRCKVYEHNHRKDMSITSAAQLLSNTLYGKRFFPYYAFNLLAGIDTATGQGAVYSYDAIGSFERTTYSAKGSGQMYIIPVLDNVIGHGNRLDNNGIPPTLGVDEVVEILKDVFLSAGERDIYTGDSLEIHIMVHNQPTIVQSFPLKAD